MQFHYGELDAHIPADAVDAVRQKFAGHENSELYVYAQADHGFNCGDRASYNAKASALAHGRTLSFLGERL
jgi:carboxymethylenebutenolidase